eukprot:jgi/Botrbrau1/5944/Bobra.0366s0114.1
MMVLSRSWSAVLSHQQLKRGLEGISRGEAAFALICDTAAVRVRANRTSVGV